MLPACVIYSLLESEIESTALDIHPQFRKDNNYRPARFNTNGSAFPWKLPDMQQ